MFGNSKFWENFSKFVESFMESFSKFCGKFFKIFGHAHAQACSRMRTRRQMAFARAEKWHAHAPERSGMRMRNP
jgi:hypothetical protein